MFRVAALIIVNDSAEQSKYCKNDHQCKTEANSGTVGDELGP